MALSLTYILILDRLLNIKNPARLFFYHLCLWGNLSYVYVLCPVDATESKRKSIQIESDASFPLYCCFGDKLNILISHQFMSQWKLSSGQVEFEFSEDKEQKYRSSIVSPLQQKL